MSERYETGDRVRHSARPEWGVGTVVKVEAALGAAVNGHAPPQRLSIRFPNGGTKMLVAGHAELVRVNGDEHHFSNGSSPLVEYWQKANASDDWLGSVAKRKVEEAMISLPADIRDPFNSLQRRLNLMLGLYRFDRSGRGLMDWAVAQTGLDDPLTRFTRQELEQKFDRWVFERDNQLVKLVQEARAPGVDPAILRTAAAAAPPAAQNAVRRITGPR